MYVSLMKTSHDCGVRWPPCVQFALKRGFYWLFKTLQEVKFKWWPPLQFGLFGVRILNLELLLLLGHNRVSPVSLLYLVELFTSVTEPHCAHQEVFSPRHNILVLIVYAEVSSGDMRAAGALTRLTSDRRQSKTLITIDENGSKS